MPAIAWPITRLEGRIVVNVVGGVVVFTVSAVVPLVVARATLSLVMSLMSPARSAEKPDQDLTSVRGIAG